MPRVTSESQAMGFIPLPPNFIYCLPSCCASNKLSESPLSFLFHLVLLPTAFTFLLS